MLKTNSKQARENIKNYIVANADFDNYGEETPEDFPVLAAAILEKFRKEKQYTAHLFQNEQALFIDWCSGLPSCLDCCYYYNRSAVDDLGTILEETEEEKERFDESAAEDLLSRLIYRELVKAAK